MPQFKFDVLIIGGGPAGSTAASVACQQGLRVLLVEKTDFPRFHVGESLLPAGNRVLHEIGVWPKIEAAGFMPKFGAEFHRADGSAVKRIVFSESLIPGLERTFQVERSRFDLLLLDHARELGAEVRLQTTARALKPIPGGYQVTLESTRGTENLIVPWIIDTTGRDPGLMSAQKRKLDSLPFPKRMAIFNHFEGVARQSGPEGGNIVVIRIEQGWFWLIPLDETRTSVGLVTTVAAYQEANTSAENYFDQTVANSTKLRELMQQASKRMRCQVTSDYSYFRSDLAQDRLVLAGDAAGFLDPVFSSGVHLATATGQQAASLVARAHAAGRALHPREQRNYTLTVKRRAGVFQELIQSFYDKDAFDVFMCQDVPWDLTPGITSIVAGHTQMTWRLWWRFKVFLLVCRLQRHWKLVKPPAETLVAGSIN